MSDKKRGVRRVKGQVSAFMIIGIILLVSTSLTLFIKGRMDDKELDKFQKLSEIPKELVPIRSFVQSCLQETGRNAVILSGRKGGNIYLQERMDSSNTPTSDVYNLYGGSIKVPYWYKHEGDNAVSQMPYLRQSYDGDYSVEDQLERYIDEKLRICLGEFRNFEDRGFEFTNISEPKSDVTITSEDVVISLDMLLDIRKGDFNGKVFDYRTAVDVDYEDAYELAKSIYLFEMGELYFERLSLSLISSASSEDSSKIPEMHKSTSFESCGNSDRYFVSDIKMASQRIVNTFLPMVKFSNTANKPFQSKTKPSDDLLKQVYESSDKSLFQTLHNLRRQYPMHYVSVLPGSFMNFEIDGQMAGSVKPQMVGDPVKILWDKYCVYNKGFAYSYVQPILIKIQDETENNEFIFQFPLQAKVKNSAPWIPGFTQSDEQISRQQGGTLDVALQNVSKMIKPAVECDKRLRLSEEFNIIAKDKYDGKSVSEADVYFQCGPLSRQCSIGITDSDGVLKTRLPECVNGMLIVGDGFSHSQQIKVMSTVKPQNTLDGNTYPRSKNITVELTPSVEKKVDVKVYDIETLSFSEISRMSELYQRGHSNAKLCGTTDPNQMLEQYWGYPQSKTSEVMQEIQSITAVSDNPQGTASGYSFDGDMNEVCSSPFSSGACVCGMKPNWCSRNQMFDFEFKNLNEFCFVTFDDWNLETKSQYNSSNFPLCRLKDDTSRSLTENEEVVLTFEKLDYETGIYEPFPVVIKANSPQTVKLTEGKYKVETKLIKKDTIRISKGAASFSIKEGEKATDSLKLKKLPEDPITMSETMLGGSVVEFEVTEEMIKDDKKGLVVPVLVNPIPETPQQIGEYAMNYEDCSSERFHDIDQILNVDFDQISGEVLESNELSIDRKEDIIDDMDREEAEKVLEERNKYCEENPESGYCKRLANLGVN